MICLFSSPPGSPTIHPGRTPAGISLTPPLGGKGVEIFEEFIEGHKLFNDLLLNSSKTIGFSNEF